MKAGRKAKADAVDGYATVRLPAFAYCEPYDLQGRGWRDVVGWQVTLAGWKRSKRRSAMYALGGGFNRSTQHLLILLEEEVCDGRDCMDMVHAAAEG